MNILFILIPIALLLAGTFVGIYLWAACSGQYDDLVTPSHKILIDESPERLAKNDN